ncbi:MAG: M15 family metallopeptidase [Dokdonella sp.]
MLATPEPPLRCNTQQRRAAIESAQALGVPIRYGHERGLRVIREPSRLRCVGEDIHGRSQWLAVPAARAWQRMHLAAANDGVELQLVSAFRSASYQLEILRRKCERGQSMDEILKVSAAPGYSEHHSGRVVDLTSPGYEALQEEFENSAAFAWLSRSAGAHGFHLSYPRDNPHGIAYEPWHWCWKRGI